MSFLPSSQRKLHKLSRDPFFSLIPRNFKLNFLLVFSSSAANLGGEVSSVFLISSMAYDLLLLVLMITLVSFIVMFGSFKF